MCSTAITCRKARANIDKGTGAIRAFGEHKGSGLALMCELLGGALTGNGASQLSQQWSQGMFSFYIDATKIDPEHFFPAEVTRMIGFVKGSKPHDSGRRRAGAGRAGRPLPRRAPEERHSAARRHLGVAACDRARGRHRRRAAPENPAALSFRFQEQRFCHVESDHDLRQPSQRLVQPQARSMRCPALAPAGMTIHRCAVLRDAAL